MGIEEIAEQVGQNCEISNAKSWGGYSICGLLLRLRELYKWEKGMQPWEKIDTSALMDWIDKKEKKWKEISDRGFRDIKINGTAHNPFDVEKINEALPNGFLYGAGYVAAMRPSFFLAQLEEVRRERGYNIFISGRELARDLVAAPAMLQGNNILVRKESIRYFIWEKIEEVSITGNETLRHALEDYGLDEEKINPESVERAVEEELESYIRHELGEASDEVLPDEVWHGLVGSFPCSKIELLVRSLKDTLGDTGENGMLSHIIANKKKGSLGFYVELLTGFRKVFFPEIAAAYYELRKTGSWRRVEEARVTGYERSKRYAQKLVDIYKTGKEKGKEWMREEIEREIGKLGI
ncbi:MAG: hypothetical protein HY930_02780 [Euryarchaeota archaeon]|nr:hypothetical protein [Euryarchaeota archaeon]